MTDVDQNNESTNYLQVKIQYWAPVSKKKNASGDLQELLEQVLAREPK